MDYVVFMHEIKTSQHIKGAEPDQLHRHLIVYLEHAQIAQTMVLHQEEQPVLQTVRNQKKTLCSDGQKKLPSVETQL